MTVQKRTSPQSSVALGEFSGHHTGKQGPGLVRSSKIDDETLSCDFMCMHHSIFVTAKMRLPHTMLVIMLKLSRRKMSLTYNSVSGDKMFTM